MVISRDAEQSRTMAVETGLEVPPLDFLREREVQPLLLERRSRQENDQEHEEDSQ